MVENEILKGGLFVNLLLVEDDMYIQELFKSAVDELSEPIQVYAAQSAQEALQLATDTEMDLLVLDIQLTDYKGTDLAKELRQRPVYAFTPLIFATALAGEELSAYRELKCSHFLIKPFTNQEIKRVLKEAIALRKHLSQTAQTIRIEQKGFILELNLDQVLYFESFGKKVEIHILIAGQERVEVITGYSLKQLKSLAETATFVQCHKSFILNPKFIYKIDKANLQIELTPLNRMIPLGKTFMEDVRA